MHNSNPYDDNSNFVLAHFSPSELQELNILQGGEHRDPSTNLHSFTPLWNLLNDQRIKPNVENWIRGGFKGGGEREGFNQMLRDSGINGDTEMAVLPKSLADLFDYAIGGKNINHNSGKRQYFLGGLLGGVSHLLSPITNAISPVLSPIMGAIKPIAGNLLSGLAPVLGNLAGTGATALGARFGNPELGAALAPTISNLATNVSSGLGNELSGGQSYDPSQDLRQAGGAGIQAVSGNVADRMMNASQNLSNSTNPNSIYASHALNLAGGLTRNLGNQYGTGYSSGNAPSFQEMSRTAATTGSNFINPSSSPVMEGLRQGLNQYGGGATPTDAVSQGILQGINQGAQNLNARYA